MSSASMLAGMLQELAYGVSAALWANRNNNRGGIEAAAAQAAQHFLQNIHASVLQPGAVANINDAAREHGHGAAVQLLDADNAANQPDGNPYAGLEQSEVCRASIILSSMGVLLYWHVSMYIWVISRMNDWMLSQLVMCIQ